jgi:flagellar biosynthesis GTPase FlhF
MQERLTEIRGLQQNMGFHAVVPADASAATLRRLFENTDNTWSSLMLSKLDESNQPWALLQFLTEKTLPVSIASQGERTSDLVESVAMVDLVKRALDNLGVAENNSDAPAAQASALGALTVNKLQKIAAHYQTESTGLSHE